MNLEQVCPKKSQEFSCINCNYTTSNKKDYNKHISTRKHALNTGLNNVERKCPKKSPNDNNICMYCQKNYPSRNGLWYHKKKCSQQPVHTTLVEPELTNSFTPNTNTMQLDTAMIIELLKQNQEFKDLLVEQNKQMMELASKIGNTTNNNIKNQQHNQFG